MGRGVRVATTDLNGDPVLVAGCDGLEGRARPQCSSRPSGVRGGRVRCRTAPQGGRPRACAHPHQRLPQRRDHAPDQHPRRAGCTTRSERPTGRHHGPPESGAWHKFGCMDEAPRRIDPTADRVSAALMLGCSPEQVGPCSRCQGLTCRYGRDAQLVCLTCRASEERAAGDAPASGIRAPRSPSPRREKPAPSPTES